mmetsp:Transcript_35321/g.99999  ORF Transcript_35321/g.99999 Transcript_35321/m.99999 type:complete len:344 (-) Transcript_35321:211-1242(-)
MLLLLLAGCHCTALGSWRGVLRGLESNSRLLLPGAAQVVLAPPPHVSDTASLEAGGLVCRDGRDCGMCLLASWAGLPLDGGSLIALQAFGYAHPEPFSARRPRQLTPAVRGCNACSRSGGSWHSSPAICWACQHHWWSRQGQSRHGLLKHFLFLLIRTARRISGIQHASSRLRCRVPAFGLHGLWLCLQRMLWSAVGALPYSFPVAGSQARQLRRGRHPRAVPGQRLPHLDWLAPARGVLARGGSQAGGQVGGLGCQPPLHARDCLQHELFRGLHPLLYGAEQSVALVLVVPVGQELVQKHGHARADPHPANEPLVVQADKGGAPSVACHRPKAGQVTGGGGC